MSSAWVDIPRAASILFSSTLILFHPPPLVSQMTNPSPAAPLFGKLSLNHRSRLRMHPMNMYLVSRLLALHPIANTAIHPLALKYIPKQGITMPLPDGLLLVPPPLPSPQHPSRPTTPSARPLFPHLQRVNAIPGQEPNTTPTQEGGRKRFHILTPSTTPKLPVLFCSAVYCSIEVEAKSTRRPTEHDCTTPLWSSLYKTRSKQTDVSLMYPQVARTGTGWFVTSRTHTLSPRLSPPPSFPRSPVRPRSTHRSLIAHPLVSSVCLPAATLHQSPRRSSSSSSVQASSSSSLPLLPNLQARRWGNCGIVVPIDDADSNSGQSTEEKRIATLLWFGRAVSGEWGRSRGAGGESHESVTRRCSRFGCSPWGTREVTIWTDHSCAVLNIPPQVIPSSCLANKVGTRGSTLDDTYALLGLSVDDEDGWHFGGPKEEEEGFAFGRASCLFRADLLICAVCSIDAMTINEYQRFERRTPTALLDVCPPSRHACAEPGLYACVGFGGVPFKAMQAATTERRLHGYGYGKRMEYLKDS
ncbi:hypothetical protein R3P38DRAFT_3206097 [Favolaschia claudopus]|uniref:Uncharacterized protein n=1 Tax=Favolaschia claudopus TaxID=2862362 RepID=A0AAW0AQI0_9AGAR